MGCFRALIDRVASANPSPSSVRSEFSADVGTLATSPKLEIRAPTQCFVRVGRSCRSVRSRSKKHRRNCRFGLENRAPERPGSVPGAPERAKSSGKTRMEPNRTAERIFFCQSSEHGATQSQTQPWRGAHGAGPPEHRYENSRMDVGFLLGIEVVKNSEGACVTLLLYVTLS